MSRRSLGRRAVGSVLAAVAAVASTWIARSDAPIGVSLGVRTAQAAAGAGGEYHPLTPTRIFDSRPGAAINDVAPVGKKPADADGEVFDIQLLGAGGVPPAADPATVLAVMVSITVVEPSRAGYLSAFPTGTSPGPSSVVNFAAGQAVPNLALVRPGTDGKLRIQLVTPGGSGGAHVLVDVFGWFSTSNHGTRGARLRPIEPGRILDTRVVADPLGAGEWVTLKIRGAATLGGANVVPADPDVVGVVVNLTGANDTPSSTQTFLSAVPEQTPGPPGTSNLNLVAGQVRANLAMVPVGPDGNIRVFNEAGSTHLIVDVVGYLLAGESDASNAGRVIPLVAPFRVLDTRMPAFGAAKLGPGQGENWGMEAFVNSVTLDGVQVGAVSGVIGNITATQLSRQYPTVPVTGFLTFYPAPPEGSPPGTRPEASNVNFPEGQDVPNLAVVRFSPDDKFRVYNGLGSTHYLFDVAAVVLE